MTGKDRRSRPGEERPLHRQPTTQWRGQRVFYVATEGAVTEPTYLRYLLDNWGQARQFHIHIRRDTDSGMKPSEVVQRLLDDRDEIADYRAQTAEEEARQPQLWALFDRDQHVGIGQALQMMVVSIKPFTTLGK